MYISTPLTSPLTPPLTPLPPAGFFLSGDPRAPSVSTIVECEGREVGVVVVEVEFFAPLQHRYGNVGRWGH